MELRQSSRQCLARGSAAKQLGFVVGPTKGLTDDSSCLTLYDMKTSTLTIRLDADLEALLMKASKRAGISRSELARQALRRQLRISQFDTLRKRIVPFAEARGFLTDEDVFNEIS